MTERAESKPDAYFVGGVNGVGKSTLLQEVVSLRPEFQIVKGSSVFMGWLGIEHGDYEALRSLPDDYKRQEFNKMMFELLSKSNNSGKTLLIDAHYFHYKRGQVLDTTGDWMAFVDALFVIETDNETLFDRIGKDTKDRDLFPENSSEYEQRVLLSSYLERTRAKALELSNKYGLPLFVIDNKEGSLSEAVQQFLIFNRKLKEGVR